jgi:thiol-disulfide isomerase/thioredoxin
MKKAILLLVAFATFSCGNAQKTAFSNEALSTTLLSIDGNQVAFQDILNQHKGKTLVIEIWASWCGDCIKAMPKVKSLQNDFPEADYVFISMDKTPEAWKNGIAKHELKGKHYMANDQMKGVFGKAMDVNWIPRYIVVDKTGKVALYRAIETDFELIAKTINNIK